MNKIISGKEIAKEVKNEVINLCQQYSSFRHPKLVIIYMGFNEASELYIRYKRKFAKQCGIDTEVIYVDKHAKFEQMKRIINRANQDENVDGIMIQLPLPKESELDLKTVLDLIAPDKDVDGLTSYSLGKAWTYDKDYPYASCTADACMKVIEATNYDLTSKNVVMIGSTIVIGQPLTAMLSSKKATVTLVNSKTLNLSQITKQADLIVSATGKLDFIKKEMLKPDVALIDVGTCKDKNSKTRGDINCEEVIDIAKWISPSPGGVGPITVAMLALHTVKAYIKHINKKEL